MKAILAKEVQLNSLLRKWWIEMTVKAGERGRTIRDNKIAGRMANGQDHPNINTERVAIVTIDPIHGPWVPHPENYPHWPQDLRDALITKINPLYTVVDDFTPTPEEII